jgi:hypothetical protein
MKNTGGFHTQGIHVCWVKGSNGIWNQSSDFHYHAVGVFVHLFSNLWLMLLGIHNFCFVKEEAMYTMMSNNSSHGSH